MYDVPTLLLLIIKFLGIFEFLNNIVSHFLYPPMVSREVRI